MKNKKSANLNIQTKENFDPMQEISCYISKRKFIRYCFSKKMISEHDFTNSMVQTYGEAIQALVEKGMDTYPAMSFVNNMFGLDTVEEVLI